jgi:hypothetical protein
MQKLRELNSALEETIKNPDNDIQLDIAKHYENHAKGLLEAFKNKSGYDEPFSIYIPSDELKDKYAEVVDLSFASNPVNWSDIVTPKEGEKGKGITEWANSSTVKHFLMAKLAARGLIKAERNKDKSNYVAKQSTPLSRKLSPYDINQFLDEHQEGNIVYWSNMSSTSEDFGVWSGNISTHISPLGGLKTKHLSHFKGEKEVTLKPFPRMKVTKVDGSGYGTKINVVQVG